MKKIIVFILFLLAPIYSVFAQTADGTFRLRAIKAPSVLNQEKLRKSAVFGTLEPLKSVVGFQVFNFSNKEYEYKEEIFISEGKHCRIFADRSMAESANQNALKITDTFDNKIYSLISSWFGKPYIPENLCLNDQKIYIVLTPIVSKCSEGYIAGYFDRRDLQASWGNGKPVLFMDGSKSDLGDTESKTSPFYRTLAHEFQHLINYSRRFEKGLREQERWLDEGFSLFAEFIYSGTVGGNPRCIPSSPHAAEFLKNPCLQITDNSENSWFTPPELYRHYGASFAFVSYLTEKYGGSNETMKRLFLQELVVIPTAGADGISEMLSSRSKNFEDVLFDMNMAILFDDVNVNNGKWAFQNKFDTFGSSGTLIPSCKRGGTSLSSVSSEYFIMPSGFSEKELINESSYNFVDLEIPIFKDKKLIAVQTK